MGVAAAKAYLPRGRLVYNCCACRHQLLRPPPQAAPAAPPPRALRPRRALKSRFAPLRRPFCGLWTAPRRRPRRCGNWHAPCSVTSLVEPTWLGFAGGIGRARLRNLCEGAGLGHSRAPGCRAPRKFRGAFSLLRIASPNCRSAGFWVSFWAKTQVDEQNLPSFARPDLHRIGQQHEEMIGVARGNQQSRSALRLEAHESNSLSSAACSAISSDTFWASSEGQPRARKRSLWEI